MSKLTNLMAEILCIDKVDASTTMEQCSEWTSLAHIQLLAELESAYQITLDPEDAIAIDSFESICEVLAGKGIDIDA